MQVLYIIAKLVFKSIKKLINPISCQDYSLLNFYDLTTLMNPFLRLFIKDRQIFLDTKLIPNIEYLELNYKLIRNELQNLLRSKEIPALEYIDGAQKSLTSDKHWKMFFIKMFGHYIEKNCALCPETTKIIKKIPSIHGAMFSILDRHKHIPKHNGLFEGDLNYHLGLIIPKGNLCKLVIDGQTKYWEEGKSILFDDMYEHEVYNDSNEQRVVLWAYVERPMPYKWLERLNKSVIKSLGKTFKIQSLLKKAIVE